MLFTRDYPKTDGCLKCSLAEAAAAEQANETAAAAQAAEEATTIAAKQTQVREGVDSRARARGRAAKESVTSKSKHLQV